MPQDHSYLSSDDFLKFQETPRRRTVMLGVYEGDLFKTRAEQFEIPFNTFCRRLLQLGLAEVEKNGYPKPGTKKETVFGEDGSEEKDEFAQEEFKIKRHRRFWKNKSGKSVYSKLANKIVEPFEVIFFWQYNTGDTEYITSTTEEHWYEKIPRPMAKKFIGVIY